MRCSCHESKYISLRLARLGHRLSVPWWSEDRTGRLSHGLEIESEHMGLVRQCSVLLGGLRLGAVRLGAEIE